ncbi:hypothetical protein BDY21DRAFT_69778 [Lineolata rhizophorae]|uniref:Uncharacterized protein n=1 Tax=Lineolata rhizophorae TaxID=578093 RepID=A0A6A6NW10_9PEZI|nr:hypothetical protein BDY21DRAFT_69778 [Lineolata rhizophorae]
MLAPQAVVRCFAPSSRSPLSPHALFAVTGLLALLILAFHSYGPTAALNISDYVHELPAASSSSSADPVDNTLPKFWSMTGKPDLEGVTHYEKPADFRVVALVFYGRPASVSILDCYLKRNLVENGGMLDEVIFLARTTNQEHLEWLDGLVGTTDSYRRVDVEFEGNNYASAYDVCEPGVMYIKIDDDIVFFEDSTIPSLVQTKVEHPEYLTVSANIMNQPSLSWIHHHLGVVKPYMPELSPPETVPNATASRWRASELPTWSGPEDFRVGDHFKGPFKGHRWLPMPEGTPIDDTPISTTTYDAFSPGLWHWTIAAQEHYSFFEHLENNELFRYKFHKWDYNYRRMGIQFIAIWGGDVIANKPIHRDDEYYFTEEVPKKLRRHAIVDGRSVVAHYSFGPQKDGIASTDILDRYRAFALENICPQ